MSDERQYDEGEVRQIFDAATRAEASAGPSLPGRDEGMTLSELHAIGSEVGIPAALISEAAAGLDRRPSGGPGGSVDLHGGARFRPRVLGVPLGVEHEVGLSRDLTEDEWARLVVDLRRTFAAKGRVEAVGPLREWRNGNLYVAVTPDDDGAVLSMGTFDGRTRAFGTTSAMLLTIAVALAVVMVITGEVAEAGAFFAPAFLAALGLGFLGANAVRLPGWARTRARQLEEIGERMAALTSGDSDDVGDETRDQTLPGERS